MITCEINGKTMSMREIAVLKRVTPQTVINTLRRLETRNPGATRQEIDKMVEEYIKRVGKKTRMYNGKPAKEWAAEIGINEMTFRWRWRTYGADSPKVYEPKAKVAERRYKKHKKKMEAYHKKNPGILRKKQEPKPAPVVLSVKEDRSPGWYERAHL